MFVDVSNIPGVMPAVAADCSGGLWLVVIAGSDEGAAGYDFSGLVGRKYVASIVHDGNTNGGSRPSGLRRRSG